LEKNDHITKVKQAISSKH